jgi:hypothetical protein
MKRILSGLSLVVLCALSLSSAVSADVAPPQQPPGFNPEPGNEITQVRMLAEIVTIDVLAVDPPQAHFSAIFTMRNLSVSTEDMAVRFPLAVNDGFFNMVEIKNVVIKVNEQTTGYERIQGPEPIYGFEGEIILRLPYDANPQNIILNDYQSVPRFIGREARWSFKELEPTPGDNLTFEIVKPIIWKQVVIELENISQNPKDGESWGFLGKAYKQAYFAAPKGYPRTDAGAVELYQLSQDAYEQTVTLKPDDGLWHAGYAELLLDYYYWVSYQDRSYTADLDLGLRELDLAVRLAPETTKVKELMDEYLYMFPDYIVKQSDGSLDFISLTATPTSVLPTGTPIPTRTASPTTIPAAARPPAEPASAPATPLCGSAALILIPLGLITWKFRRGGD